MHNNKEPTKKCIHLTSSTKITMLNNNNNNNNRVINIKILLCKHTHKKKKKALIINPYTAKNLIVLF